jgi:pimeloyl-ACP methyl ester carboxylesterase
MSVTAQQSNGRTAIRPFTIETSESELEDLRARIAGTRWPEKETVDDQSQGVALATMQAVARYWAEEYDWRKCEEKLKALPHFITEIDGLDIHFIHVRSKHEDALPLLVSHGWPGSVIEQLKIIDPLTNPTAHGGSAADAFHVVIPSMPGYGFSGKPAVTGWGPEHMARAWAELMKRLGYDRYVATGGDWGAQIVDVMGAQAPPGLLGIHTNFPGAVRPDVAAGVQSGVAPSGLDDEETRIYEKLSFFFATDAGYAIESTTHPQSLYGIADSPVGLAAWMLDHDATSLALISRVFVDGAEEGLTRDDVLDNITHYWLTNTVGLCGTSLLGKQGRLLRPERLADRRQQGDRGHPGGRERLPRRDLRAAAELGGGGLPQAHPLQQARQGRALRGLGAAGAVGLRGPRRPPVAALDGSSLGSADSCPSRPEFR